MASNKQLIEKSPHSLTEILEKSAAVGPSIIKKLGDWVEKSNSLKVLVAGKTGIGKSTLINGIIGRQVTKEGHKLTPETSEVQGHSFKVDTIEVQIFDSPGLQDKSKNEEKFIAEIQDKCKDVDLFLYCIRMSETRFFSECDDAIAMKRLFKALGASLWENGIIVLTFANDVVGIAKDKGVDETEYFQDRFKKLTQKIRDFLRDEVKIQPEVADNVTIACAGHANKPLLPSVSEEDIATSHSRNIHWLSNLWLKALRRTKLAAQPAMIQLNLHRILQNMDEYSPQEMADTTTELIEMQPIMLSQQGAKLGKEHGDIGENIGAAIGKSIGKREGNRMAVSLRMNMIMVLLLNLAQLIEQLVEV